MPIMAMCKSCNRISFARIPRLILDQIREIQGHREARSPAYRRRVETRTLSRFARWGTPFGQPYKSAFWIANQIDLSQPFWLFCLRTLVRVWSSIVGFRLLGLHLESRTMWWPSEFCASLQVTALSQRPDRRSPSK